MLFLPCSFHRCFNRIARGAGASGRAASFALAGGLAFENLLSGGSGVLRKRFSLLARGSCLRKLVFRKRLLRQEGGFAERRVGGAWLVRVKSFASFEVLLSLLFAVAMFSLLLPYFSVRPSYSRLHAFQLAQDFAEVSLASQRLRGEIIAFKNGEAGAQERLAGEYSQVLRELGDYCVEARVAEKVLKANCGKAFSQRVSARRLAFDGTDFFEIEFSLYFS